MLQYYLLVQLVQGFGFRYEIQYPGFRIVQGKPC